MFYRVLPALSNPLERPSCLSHDSFDTIVSVFLVRRHPGSRHGLGVALSCPAKYSNSSCLSLAVSSSFSRCFLVRGLSVTSFCSTATFENAPGSVKLAPLDSAAERMLTQPASVDFCRLSLVVLR